jgi:NADH-quinone oxidoreductase subunit L
MPRLAPLIIAFPLAGFLVLALAGSRLPRRTVGVLGAGAVGLSALAALAVGISFLTSPPGGGAETIALWTWFEVGAFRPQIALHLDALAVVMALVVTGVGFLILLYSVEFMAGDEGYSRFFAYMNLFVASMTALVLASDLLFLYVGWEGVGLSSYLLIGFWYRDPANGRAARKAFVVTRIGDAAMAVGLFILFARLGTLDIQEVLAGAPLLGDGVATAAALLLLAGAAGKSAQLPLQTWLPDAMAGPTPVSALIHAATMVTAGVYLIARTNGIFLAAPAALEATAAIGALSLLIGALSALVQTDIKRVLAYSTMSQVGYMFLALGAGAWAAAIFHFMTHAFFKAALFLGAGNVILALSHEHDLRRMGGLRRELPLTFWCFLAAAASLAALPLVTAGYYSKELILTGVRGAGPGSGWLWAAGAAAALVTAVYAFRMVFLVFFGERSTPVTRRPGLLMAAPLAVLAALSLAGGFVEAPAAAGGTLFTSFLKVVLPPPPAHEEEGGHLAALFVSILALAGLGIAWVLYIGRPRYAEALGRSRPGSLLRRFWEAGWGFDRLYDRLFAGPFVRLARACREDLIDGVYGGAARLSRLLHLVLSRTQTGSVRWYAALIGAGAALLLALVVFT